MPPPPDWTDFVRAYRRDGRFWYFPHAHVGTNKFLPILRILKNFEGQTWRDRTVVSAMRAANLTSGRGAGARMLRKATENLGLCWFENQTLQMTPAGRALLNGAPQSDIFTSLLWKYQLSNPINDGAKGFRLFPHAVLLDVLLSLDGKITRDEFILFVGRNRTHDIRVTLDNIRSWRQLSPGAQNSVINALGQEFETRRTDTSYTLGFHGCAPYLTRFNDARGRKGIRIKPGHKATAEARLDEHKRTAEWIEYRSKADCIAALGDVEQSADAASAVEYYLDTSQPQKAVDAFSKLPPTARKGLTVEQFRATVFLEKDLEDYLVDHLERIEPGLELIRRQRVVSVGVIDILARSPNGDIVVIELKKGRASDKVFGQICRYMGCIAAHHNPNNRSVRGYIIGSEIDEKLRYASRVAPQGVMKLKQFRRDPNSPQIFIEG